MSVSAKYLRDALTVNQGRGYAGALLKSITALVSPNLPASELQEFNRKEYTQADSQDRATWLTSSNVLNRGFYNSQGFITVGTITLGESNADWHESPILFDVASRRSIWISYKEAHPGRRRWSESRNLNVQSDHHSPLTIYHDT